MQQPEGFCISGNEDLVCKLKRSIYGLKQAFRRPYLKFDEVVTSMGFEENKVDDSAYTSKSMGANLSSLCYIWMIYCWLLMTLACYMR